MVKQIACLGSRGETSQAPVLVSCLTREPTIEYVSIENVSRSKRRSHQLQLHMVFKTFVKHLTNQTPV